MSLVELFLIGVIIFLASFVITIGLRWFKKNAPGKPYDPRVDGSNDDSMDPVWDLDDKDK